MCVCSSPPPRFIIIDNGTEFIGENFQRILKDYGIQVHRIHAYTPQENGKIERWWKTIEHSATSPLVEPYLSYIINEYNTKWEHCSLKERYYSSFWDFLIDQFNYLNLFSNISECIQTFV